jgi:HEPN domain-containing protein
MIDPDKQIAYWRQGAEEDRTVARELLDRGHTRHALFLSHLALEKALKAHACKATRDLAPRIHNLTRLAEFTGLDVPANYGDVLADMNAFNIEGRYPDLLVPPPSVTEAQLYANRAEEVLEWLLSLL